MWVQQGEAFVWVDHANGGMDMIGTQRIMFFETGPGVGLARIQLPRDFSLGHGDTLSAIVNLDKDEGLGEGPWIA